MSSADRSTLAAVAFSLAVHAAVATGLVLRPPMFRTVHSPAPIEVSLVPARPLEFPPPPGGGGSPPPRVVEKLAREPAPDEVSHPRPPRRAKRTQAAEARSAPLPEPELPRAAAVDAGPPTMARPASPDDALEAPSASASDLGIGAPGGSAWGGVGGGSGGGRGAGAGSGSGPGRGAFEVKPRELRRPSYAEMRALYPEDARRDGLQARVRLQLLVDASGRVADVRVVRGAGHGFDEAAAALARRFVFQPGTRDGRPVPMWITLTYSFEIEG